MAARRRRTGSHHRPAPIAAPPWWAQSSERSWFEREQGAGASAPQGDKQGDKVSTLGVGWVAPSSPRAQKCLELIHALVESGRYEFSAHTQSHMIEEGFDKEHCVGAVLGGRVLEVYVPPQQRRERERFLVAGRFHLSARNTCPLHIVCELFDTPAPRPKPGATHIAMEEHVRFVTAYIPRPPEWISPHVRAPRA